MVTFLDFPREIRNFIYSYLFILDEPIDLVGHGLRYRSLNLDSQVLRTNSQIFGEAREVLYSGNHFRFPLPDSRRTSLFFNRIGRDNASRIRFVVIYFSDFCNVGNGFIITRTCATSLDLIKTNCTNLRRFVVKAFALDETTWGSFRMPPFAPRPLSIIDAQLRAFSNLQEITVEVLGNTNENDTASGTTRGDIQRQMESLEWNFKKIKIDGNRIQMFFNRDSLTSTNTT